MHIKGIYIDTQQRPL